MHKSYKKHDYILGLIEVLKKETDEDNMIDIYYLRDLLCEEMDVEDISLDKMRNYLSDLDESNQFELIVEKRPSKKTLYGFVDHLFEIQELRLMMDAIGSARFIKKKDKERMLGKIKHLTSNHLAESLVNQVYVNEFIDIEQNDGRYIIFDLHYAIQEKKLIKFQYGRYNVKKEFVLSKDGAYRELEPYALYWNNDFYYLIGKYPAGEYINLRIDRMRNVKTLDNTFLREPSFDIAKYTQYSFNMYNGELKDLKVEFDNHLINVILDRLGSDVNIEETDRGVIILRTKATISDGLVRWLLTWGSDAKVIDPPELVQRIKEESKKMMHIYYD